MMTKRELGELMDSETVREKVAEANDFIFENLKERGFSVMETRLLISSMDRTLKEITKLDPLRKLSDFPSC